MAAELDRRPWLVSHEDMSARRIFVSYRRSDAAAHAGRLTDHVEARFGTGSVFLDVEAIGPGVDFARAIDEAIARMDAVLS